MKKVLLLLLLCLFVSFNGYAFDKINDKGLILLTGRERQDVKEFEALTMERARNACGLLGKELVSFEFKEIGQDHILPKSAFNPKDDRWTCETVSEHAIPTRTELLPVPCGDMETFYHDGGAWVAGLTLGIIPTIIPYMARVATDIQCRDKSEIGFKSN